MKKRQMITALAVFSFALMLTSCVRIEVTGILEYTKNGAAVSERDAEADVTAVSETKAETDKTAVSETCAETDKTAVSETDAEVDETAEATDQLKQGIYILRDSGMELHPYINIDTVCKQWIMGGDIATSYAISGVLEISGDRVMLLTEDGSEMVAECEILSDTEIRPLKVNEEKIPLDYWNGEGKVYSYHYFFYEGYEPDLAGFDMIMSADEALAWSREHNVTVIENMKCTSGDVDWYVFYESVSLGRPASALVARYYTLDREHTDPDYYEEIKDDYPVLYFYLVNYDGESFTVSAKDSAKAELDIDGEVYQNLLHFTGDAPPTANYSTYDYYVLTDDPDMTWEKIEHGMFSSQYGDWVRHCAVYQNIID